MTTIEQIKELIEKNLDEIDKELLIQDLQPVNGFFPITSIHRDDLEGLGFDTSNVSDQEMAGLAGKMADDYCNQMFHQSLEIIAEDYYKIPKQKPVFNLNEVTDILKSDFRDYERGEVDGHDVYRIVTLIADRYGIDEDTDTIDLLQKRICEYYNI